jgi:hypothetical protein
MLSFEKHNLSITEFENDLLKKTILSHKERYSVGIPGKWKEYTNAMSNIKYVTAEQWGQSAPMLTFEALFYNYVYEKVDKFIQEHRPDRYGESYHTEHCWYMIYENDSGQVPHNHAKTNGVKHEDNACSGVYYVEMPHDGYRAFNIYDDNPRENSGKIIETLLPKEKQLFLFDSNLWHDAVQRDTKNRSIAIAFNCHFI